jgi:molecular chaperone IbpA
MNTIDLTPFYRSSIGFDRLASMLDTALSTDQASAGYPAYNINTTGENRYAITLAVAGFAQDEIDIQVENNVLTVRGKKEDADNNEKFLYQGITLRPFERKFNLADHVEVTGADLNNGLLTINLVKEIPEAMKPRKIRIETDNKTIEHQSDTDKAA